MALKGTDEEKFKQLSAKNYKNQAQWFLNAYWHTFAKAESETVWKFAHKFIELDLQNHGDGNALDELNAHRFLEAFKNPLTVREMRDLLRSSGAVAQNFKFDQVPLTHFLVTHFKVDFKQLVNASQGDNKEEVEKAQRLLEEVISLLTASEEKAKAAAAALREAEARESEARTKEAEAKSRETEAEAAKRELEAALIELKAQEDAYNAKLEDLKHKSENATGPVAQNKAKAELAQTLNEPTLPLRKARITQEAAVKKADKTRQAAADARAAAEQSTKNAVEAKKKSAHAKEEAERAVEAARKKVEEAEAYLDEVKSRPGNAQGSLWWIERELHERKAFLPTSKGGYSKRTLEIEKQ